MRIGPRLVAAALAVIAGGSIVAAPVLAQSSDDAGTPAAGFEQVAAQARATTTVKKRNTGTAVRRGSATTVKKPATTVPTTVAPTAPPTVATTLPLPTQSTTLSPITAPPTTAAPINDAKATRLVNRVILALVGLALLVAFLTFWYWRATKPVPPALDGLDLLSTRKWLRGKPEKRARLLAEFHAKRGPVPEEVIARTNAPTVKVGAAVAAPSPAAAPLVVPAMAGARSELGALVSGDPAEQPIVMVPEASNGAAGGVPAADAAAAPGLAPQENGHLGLPAEPPAEPAEPAADPLDAGFTVVARRPRGDGGDGSPPA